MWRRFFYTVFCLATTLFSFEIPIDVPQWMHDQIAEDLQPYIARGVTRIELEKLMHSDVALPWQLVQFTIQDNVISIFPDIINDKDPRYAGLLDRGNSMLQALNILAQKQLLPNLSFILSIHDALDDTRISTPIFAFAKQPALSPNILLIPDFEALHGNFSFLSEVSIGQKKYPWRKKINQGFWRGNTTGALVTKSHFLQMPRTQAVTYSLKFPDLINARFSGLVQCNEVEDILRTYGSYFGDAARISEHLLYKYQILIDGNTSAYSRAFWQFFSQCTTFKQTSPSMQWYYRALVPYVHYIPLHNDLSDLPQKILWAKKHDKQCKKISKAALEFAKNNLSQERVYQYLYILLTEYSKLYTETT